MTNTTPFARKRETLTHKHIQRMTPSELAAIDAEITRLAERGVSTDRTGLIRIALAQYFDSTAAERTRAAKAAA